MPAARVTEPISEPWGDLVPYADPAWYQGLHSPHFNETHVALRNEVREWVDDAIIPNAGEWDEAKEVPHSIYKELATRGYIPGLVGGKYQVQYAKYTNKVVPPDQWDMFHELIVIDEISRSGSGGVTWNLLAGFSIGCPPLLQHGKKQVVERVIPRIFAGDERTCLAITEPGAGSDVANLACEAKLTEDGKHYIVNGEKKWITNGIWSEYFVTAVRTGGPGMGGISILLVERKFGGVNTRRMDCTGAWSSGTTYVTFEDVKVPVENLIGKENGGFKAIMTNFNHERLGLIIQAVRLSRCCYEEAMKYAHKRKTFGIALVDQPVVRNKFAHMARMIEATYAWTEAIIYTSMQLGNEKASLRLGGNIAGLKAQATTTFAFCAKEAYHIFGGLGYTRGGQGGVVERLNRDVGGFVIPGGAEEIMLDLSIRQSLKVHKNLGMKL